MASFRGSSAPDFDWLRSVYLSRGGAQFPTPIGHQLSLLRDWSTDLRYSPGNLRQRDAKGLRTSVNAVLQWADGRL